MASSSLLDQIAARQTKVTHSFAPISLSDAMLKASTAQPKVVAQKSSPLIPLLTKLNSGFAQPVLNYTLKPIEQGIVDTKNQAVKQFKYFTGPTATPQQRQSILDNQKVAQQKGFKIPKGNSASGRIKAQQMFAQGKSNKEIQAYLTKDRAGLSKLTGEGLNAALVGTSLIPGEAAVTRTKQAVGGLKTALGKARFVQAAEKADKLSSLGGTTVQEAGKTRIPVVSPTEAPSAGRKLGSTALLNSDRRSIPITGKSSTVLGKAKTFSDAQYAKESTKLAKQYEKESKALEGVQSNRGQEVLQNRIDLKYQKLQEALDKKYGQTNVSFKSKPVGPRSAFDKEPQATYSPPKTATGTKTTKVPVTTEKPVKAPKTPSAAGEPKVSGSALRTEQKAVQRGLENELSNKATYGSTHYKEDAAKAVKLLDENPQKAYDIALGKKAGENGSHEAAVYHAVANRELALARKTGDFSRVQELAASPRHAAVSEAAQRLGAEGYNLTPHDPIAIMQDVQKSREAAVTKKVGTTVQAEAKKVGTAVKTATPKISRQDWHSFIKSIECK